MAAQQVPPTVKIIPDDVDLKFRRYLSYFKPIIQRFLRDQEITGDPIERIPTELIKGALDRTTNIFFKLRDIRNNFIVAAINNLRADVMNSITVMFLIYIFLFILFPNEDNTVLVKTFNDICTEMSGLGVDLNPGSQDLNNVTSLITFVKTRGGVRRDLIRELQIAGVVGGQVGVVEILRAIVDSLDVQQWPAINFTNFHIPIDAIPSDSAIMSQTKPTQNDGIDPTLFTEEFIARRRRWIPMNIDFEALLNDPVMKEYKFVFDPQQSTGIEQDEIKDKIFGEATRARFGWATNFTPTTLFEARAKSLYAYLSTVPKQKAPTQQTKEILSKLDLTKYDFIGSITDSNFKADMRSLSDAEPRMEKGDQQFQSLNQSEIARSVGTGRKIYYPTLQSINKEEKQYPQVNPGKEVNIIKNQLRKISFPVEKQVKIPKQIHYIHINTEIPLFPKIINATGNLVSIKWILQNIQISRYIIREINDLLDSYGMKIQWFEDIKRTLEMLEIGHLPEPNISFQDLFMNLALSKRRPVRLTFVDKVSGQLHPVVSQHDFLVDDIHTIEKDYPTYVLLPDPFWKKVGLIGEPSLLYDIIRDAEINNIIPKDAITALSLLPSDSNDDISLFASNYIPGMIRDPNNLQIVYNLIDTLNKYDNSLYEISNRLDTIIWPQLRNNVYLETITDDFRRLLRSIGSGIQETTCDDIFFYQDNSSTTGIPTTGVDMFRFVEKILPLDRTLFDKLPESDREISRYRDKNKTPKMTCHWSQDLNLDIKLANAGKISEFTVDTKRITTFSDLLNFFKTDDPKETKLQKYIKFVTFVYIFFDPIEQARPAINGLIKSIAILYCLYIRRLSPQQERNPINPYEILSVQDFTPYNISSIRDSLFGDQRRITVGEILKLILSKVSNVSDYRHVILSIIGNMSAGKLPGISRTIFIDVLREDSFVSKGMLLENNIGNIIDETFKQSLGEKSLTDSRDFFNRMTINSFRLPIPVQSAKIGVQNLLSIIRGIKKDSLDHELLNLITVEGSEGIDNEKYFKEYRRISSGRIVFEIEYDTSGKSNIILQSDLLHIYLPGSTNPSKLEENEFPLDTFDVSTTFVQIINDQSKLDLVIKKIYSVKAGYVYSRQQNPSFSRYISNTTMIKPCFVHNNPGGGENITTVILPFIAECDGYIEVEGESVASTANEIDPGKIAVLSAILEYPAQVVKINRANNLLQPGGSDISVQKIYDDIKPYLPKDPEEGDIGGLNTVITISRTPEGINNPTPKSGGYDKVIHLVEMTNISSIVEGVVGFVKTVAPLNIASRILHPRPHHVWTTNPLKAGNPTEGAIYVSPTTIPPVVDLFFPAIETDMFLASFFSPLLQLEYLKILHQALQYSRNDNIPTGGGNRTKRIEDLKVLGSGDKLDTIAVKRLMIEGLSLDNGKKFRNLLLSQIGTRIQETFNDASLDFLTGINLDRESMMFFSSDQENITNVQQRSINYAITFNGYMELFKRRRDKIVIDVIDVKTIRNEQQMRDFIKQRAEGINLKVNETNKEFRDAESQYLNELVTRNLWMQERF